MVAFVAALILGLSTAARKPERQWYRGRGLAESARTLAWCYAVDGHPFSLAAPGAEALLVQRLREILGELGQLSTSSTQGSTQITAAMR
jgi:hypothetical protein